MAVETIVIKSPVVPVEDPAHVARMIAVADGTPAPEVPAATSDRPSWLPEKFATAEDMAKAYGELSTKLGENTSTTPPVTPPVVPAVVPPVAEATTEQAAADLAGKGLELSEFSKEFAETGALSADSYTKLKAAGYPEELVNSFIEGQKARGAAYATDIKSTIGGDANFTSMVEWAGANLSPGELAAYNSAIDSGDADKAKLAVLGTYQKFTDARPTEPRLIAGGPAATASADVYESLAQMQADMRDDRYKSDPAFRAKVASKLGRSSIL
jgi:hypothetical protein